MKDRQWTLCHRLNTRMMYACVMVLVLLLTACNIPTQDQTPTATSEGATSVDLVTPFPTATETLPKILRICTADFPETLFPYDGLFSTTKTNILAMIQESPFETVDGILHPTILEKIPSQSGGDLHLKSESAQEGQVIVNAWGELVVLKPGTLVRPSGCRQSECAIIWDGEGPLEMDRMVLEFTLREDLAWSDGNPVTSNDSIFSFKLADAMEATGDAWALERTETYTALDEQTIQWVGRPGFSTADLSKFFWGPQPSHLFDATWSWADILSEDRMITSPLSYGPFVLTERDEAQIHFKPNPNYYRADESLPIIDALTIQLVDGGPQEALEALKSGQCDLLDSTFALGNHPDLLGEIKGDEQYDVHPMMRGDWIQLVFGIASESSEGFDDDRQGLLDAPQTRQAIAACLDREKLRDVTTGGLSALWSSFLPTKRSQLGLDNQITYDPQLGQDLLLQAGWGDTDGDPETPLIAQNVKSVPMGTELLLSLTVSNSGHHQDLAKVIKGSLGECGIGVDINNMPSSELYAPGLNGPLFSRRFDLALISWQPMPDLDCRYYMTSQVPDVDNAWIGTNIAGLSDERYDQACSDAALALPGEFGELVSTAEQRFLDEMPSIPLFSPPEMVVMSVDWCMQKNVSSENGFFSLFANIDRCP